MDPVKNTVPSHLMREDLTTAKPKNVLGKDDFMKLLMTQMRHQDPLNPLDHKDFSAQLAQFGSLEQLTNIGTGIQNLKSGLNEGSKYNVLGLIGKKIQATGNEINLMEGHPVVLHHLAKEGVSPFKAEVYDGSGKMIREIALGGKESGQPIQWDGKNADGNPQPAGKYNFRVYGVDSKGQGVDLSTELGGKVTGVDMQGPEPMLLVQTEAGQVRMELSKVKNVAEEAEAARTGVGQPAINKPAGSPIGKVDMSEFNRAQVASAPQEDDGWERGEEIPDFRPGFVPSGGFER